MTPEQARVYLAGLSDGDVVLYSDDEGDVRSTTVTRSLHTAQDGREQLIVAGTDRPIKHWPVRLAEVASGEQRLLLMDPPLAE